MLVAYRKQSFSRLGNFRGFNLIELLVSLVVVSISLFAIAKIQIMGMHGMESSKETTTSMVNVSSLIDRLSSHRDAVRIYLDNVGDFKTGNVNKTSLNVSNHESCLYEKESTNVNDAKKAIVCEIQFWIDSIYSELNLQNSTDICVNVKVSDSKSELAYSSGFNYAVPKMTVAYAWNKSPDSSSLSSSCSGNDSSTLENFAIDNAKDSDSNSYADSSVGFVSMEYIMP